MEVFWYSLPTPYTASTKTRVKHARIHGILEEEKIPFLTSNIIQSVLRLEFDALSISLTASNLFFHSFGARGVARIEGSSNGRCETPPSNYKETSVINNS